MSELALEKDSVGRQKKKTTKHIYTFQPNYFQFFIQYENSANFSRIAAPVLILSEEFVFSSSSSPSYVMYSYSCFHNTLSNAWSVKPEYVCVAIGFSVFLTSLCKRTCTQLTQQKHFRTDNEKFGISTNFENTIFKPTDNQIDQMFCIIEKKVGRKNPFFVFDIKVKVFDPEENLLLVSSFYMNWGKKPIQLVI